MSMNLARTSSPSCDEKQSGWSRETIIVSNYSCVVEETADTTRAIVRVGGDLHVSNAFALHQKLAALVEKYSQLEIVLSEVTAFDVSAMQILLAARRERDTRVTVTFGEGCDSASHWLQVSGMLKAFAA